MGDVTSKDQGLQDLHSHLFQRGGFTKPDEELFYCFLVRTARGWPVFTNDGRTNLHDLDELVYASDDRRELATIKGSSPPIRYHALVVELGKALKRFREFVVFNSSQCYTEYLLAYKRA